MAGKIVIYGSVIAAVVVAYLALAHFFIFYKIKTAGLEAPNRQNFYIIGTDKTKNLSYAALGDSLTAGVGALKYEESYPYLVARILTDEKAYKINLKNFSYPGAKTSDLINNLLEPAVAAQPNLVTLLIGINDAYGNVSAAAFERNYQYILERLAKGTSAKIYLISLPYIGSPKLLLTPYNYDFYWKIKRFNEIIKKLAIKYQVNYIDLAEPAFIEFKKNQSFYAEDLFHPSASGYKVWARIIYDGINQ